MGKGKEAATEKVRLMLSVTRESHTRVKICAVKEGTTVSALFEAWVEKHCPKV